MQETLRCEIKRITCDKCGITCDTDDILNADYITISISGSYGSKFDGDFNGDYCSDCFKLIFPKEILSKTKN